MNNIDKIIKDKHFKINDVIAEAQVSRTHFYDIRKGKRNPSIKTAKKLSKVLNVSLDKLFPSD